jgi:hypothetical protein
MVNGQPYKGFQKNHKHQIKFFVARIFCGNYMHKKKEEANVKTHYEFGK